MPIHSLTCALKKTLLLSLVPLTNVCFEFEKKFATDAAKLCVPHGSCGGSPSQNLVFGLRFFFFGQFSTEGTEDKSASVTQTEVEQWNSGKFCYPIFLSQFFFSNKTEGKVSFLQALSALVFA